jgi:hypothetical protein
MTFTSLTKPTLVLVTTFFSYSILATEIPHIFSADTPAKAEEVNENFAVLADATIVLKNINNVAEDIEVNCIDNPTALQVAYFENLYKTAVSFNITGRCYGDLESFNGEGIQQQHGQTKFISGDEANGGTLIPDPVSNAVSLWGTFNGGLYLTNLTIELGPNGIIGFSRNSQGSLTKLNIIGSGIAENYRTILVQAGAQTYIGGVTVNNVNNALWVKENAVVRFYNNESGAAFTTNNVDIAIRVESGGTIRQRGGVNLNASTYSLFMDGNSTWQADSFTNHVINSDIAIRDSSFASFAQLTFTGDSFWVDGSQVQISASDVDANKLNCSNMAQVNVDNIADLLMTAPASNCIDDTAAARLVNLLKP